MTAHTGCRAGPPWLVAREHDWGTLRDAECLGVTRLQPYALVTVDPKAPAAVAGTRRRLPPSTTCYSLEEPATSPARRHRR